MPTAINVPRNDAGIIPPPAPSDLLTSHDVALALQHANKMQRSYEIQSTIACPTVDEVSHAGEYVHKVFATKPAEAAAPPWFGPALEGILERKLGPIREQMATMNRGLAVAHNATCQNGLQFPFRVVPFNNGSDPCGQGHNLPPLNDINDILGLSNDEVNRYCAGYGIPINQLPHLTYDSRKSRIAVYIGCRVPLLI